ncbi:DUF2933 domain-containing protein [Noviherbaspirillum sp. CPCC 100848]|uniref:DUF2933 domain-containing protein n=1 Tax=Noviherbaspirillum album TaxID=3080276 RepID=A0ABU6J3C9_9BURK|nr:DUF2933 domain-containing protein [Noviherbaspirillum sp. CPCC 100848]MEC4718133.1 DUF2933 domain-containing protein [Noviherbaspirillum sp. CPCC 100848]
MNKSAWEPVAPQLEEFDMDQSNTKVASLHSIAAQYGSPITYREDHMNRNPSHPSSAPRPNWSRVNQWLLWLGLAAAVSWLVVRHGAHLLEIAPFLILLACPLMHLLGHGGHGGHENAEAGGGSLPGQSKPVANGKSSDQHTH